MGSRLQNSLIASLVAICLIVIQPIPSSSANQTFIVQAKSAIAAPIPVITRGVAHNQLVVNPGKWPAGYALTMSWKVSRKTVSGETKKYYLRQIEDCGQPITVTVTGKKKGFPSFSRTSKSFIENTCEFHTLAFPAWGQLADCGATGGNYCAPFDYDGVEQFLGVTRAKARSFSWFRVPIDEIQPEQVKSWRVVLTGSQRSYAMNLIAYGSASAGNNSIPIAQGSPITGDTLFSSKSFFVQPQDGYLYLGLSYFDIYGVGETLRIKSIQLFVEYEPSN